MALVCHSHVLDLCVVFGGVLNGACIFKLCPAYTYEPAYLQAFGVYDLVVYLSPNLGVDVHFRNLRPR